MGIGKVTESQLMHAKDMALRRIQRSKAIVATEVDAGTIITSGKPGHRVGYQVFVKVARYSDELLASDPDSGGLLEEART